MKKPRVSVIIPNYKGSQFITTCLDSLLQENPRDAYEIIVVDDCSPDDSVSRIRERYHNTPTIQLITLDKNYGGPAKPAAIALQKSRGEFILYLNNDTVIQPGWTTAITKLFDEHPRCAIAQAKILRMGTNQIDYAGDYISPFGFLVERARNAEDKGQFDTPTPVFSIKGTTMIMRRDVLDTIGFFDEDYIYAIEETDLTWRAWLAGYEVWYHPRFTVSHAFNTYKKPKQYYVDARIIHYGCRNTIMTIYKNAGARTLCTMLPLNILLWVTLGIGWLLRGNMQNAAEIVRAFFWLVRHIPLLQRKRAGVQRLRTQADSYFLPSISATQPISYYIGKARAYLLQKPF